MPSRKHPLYWVCLIFLFISTKTFTIPKEQEPTIGTHAMVVSNHELASKVGVEILKKGGNAIDAAVAVGYALAVVEPCCGNIGGGGFMLIRFADGKVVFLNFREKAPALSKSDMYLDKNGQIIPEKSTRGYLAVAVPGTVMGLETALKKYGTLSRREVMAPAIKLAEQGFVLTRGDIQYFSKETESFKKQPNVGKIFLRNKDIKNQSIDQIAYQPGERLIQKDLAKTLKEISKHGSKAFYHGDIAKTIVKASQENGGILSLKDFENYNIEELKPMECSYRGYSILSSPPPSSGGFMLCEMLNHLEKIPLSQEGFHHEKSINAMVNAMHQAYHDRNQLGDPDFGHSTSHYSIVDTKGNNVSVTYTLNSHFGAHVIAGNTGFFLNNEMDDFSSKPKSANQFGLVQGKANKIEPNKRPLSSMTPTIVTKDNKTFLNLGAAGGPFITTSVLQTILNVIDYQMNIQEAVNAPRFHHQYLPKIIYVEPKAFSDFRKMKLLYPVEEKKELGVLNAILTDQKNHTLDGAADPRKPTAKAIGF